MVRKSKREIERAVEGLTGDSVATEWSPDSDDADTSPLGPGERELESETRIWRDEAGEWHFDDVRGDGR